MKNRDREKSPPRMGLGRGLNSNCGFQPRPQQYVQRHMVQHRHHLQPYQHNHHHHHHQQQRQQHHHHQQQRQWLRKDQLSGGTNTNVVEEVEKTMQSEAINSRFF